MLVGYARVSARDQNLDYQLDKLKEHGCEKIYAEKITSIGKRRPELEKLMDDLESGDILVICYLDRLVRSPADLVNLVGRLHNKSCSFRSLNESWADMTTAHGKLVTNVLVSVAGYFKDLLSGKQAEGIAAAKRRGKHLGRPYKYTPYQRQWIIESLRNEMSISEISRIMGCCRETIRSIKRSINL